jgi:hypothetical protein
MNLSIYTCNNGTVNTESDTTPGDCKLDTKPQPQWANNWLTMTSPNRQQVYNDWKRLIQLKINEPVFEGDYAISPDNNNIRQRIYIFDNALPSTSLKNVVVLANMSVASQSINPSFPYTGTWYNLMDNTPITVTNTTATITLAPGTFRVYGNQPASTLGNNDYNALANVSLYPNPTSGSFSIKGQVYRVEVYSITGQRVKLYENITSEDYQFNINDLNSGIYLVKAYDGNNNSSTMKLIKQ